MAAKLALHKPRPAVRVSLRRSLGVTFSGSEPHANIVAEAAAAVPVRSNSVLSSSLPSVSPAIAPPHATKMRARFPVLSTPGTPSDTQPLLRAIFRDGWTTGTWDRSARIRLLLVFLLVLGCSWTGIILSRQSEGVATIWLSNGVLFGLLITQPPRRWLAYFAMGLCADTLADMIFGDPFRLAIGVSLANSVEVFVSSLLLTWIFGYPVDLSRRRHLVGFLLIAVVGATALTGVLGAAWTMLFVDAGPFRQLWRTWYLGDMLGMAILAPLLVILQRPSFFAVLRRDQLVHTMAVLSVPTLASILVFLDNKDPLIFFVFPPLLLVAFRLGFPGTVLNIVLIAFVAIGMTVKGHGPLMLITGPHMLLHRIVIAQIFVAAAIFTMFPIAALLEERHGLELSLAASEKNFRQLAHADELTGLRNRRAFNLHLEEAWQAGQADRTPVSLVLLDADLFKQFNDVYGHLEGDRCLRSLAVILGTVMGAHCGTAARFGGEEFAIILPGITREQARRVAESIRQAVFARSLPHPCSPVGVQTVSLGVASLVPKPDQPSFELINLADTALYAAKVLGRNQVACA